VPEDEHVDQRLSGGGCGNGEDHREGAEEQAGDGDGDEGDERRQVTAMTSSAPMSGPTTGMISNRLTAPPRRSQ